MDDKALTEWIENQEQIQFVRSGGPGGQNVNKVNTKVTLKLPISELPVLPEEHERVQKKLANKINSDGELVIQASDTRSQTTNRQTAQTRAFNLLKAALAKPKKRHQTKPSKAAHERRIQEKKERGQIKKQRKTPETENL